MNFSGEQQAFLHSNIWQNPVNYSNKNEVYHKIQEASSIEERDK